jgi:hypothetical protein
MVNGEHICDCVHDLFGEMASGENRPGSYGQTSKLKVKRYNHVAWSTRLRCSSAAAITAHLTISETQVRTMQRLSSTMAPKTIFFVVAAVIIVVAAMNRILFAHDILNFLRLGH